MKNKGKDNIYGYTMLDMVGYTMLDMVFDLSWLIEIKSEGASTNNKSSC